MKRKITGISIHRITRAHPHGIAHETVIYLMRPGQDTARYSTNDTLQRGNISDASVRRAERAQGAIAARNAFRLSTLDRADKLYYIAQGAKSYSDCIEQAATELSTDAILANDPENAQ